MRTRRSLPSVQRIHALPAFLLIAATAHAGPSDLFPFLHGRDPKIRSLETYVTAPIKLNGARIAVFPFVLEQEGRPRPPDPAPLLVDALHFHVPTAVVVPFQTRPGSTVGRAAAARERSADFFVEGRAHRIYRDAGGGYVIDVTVRLLEVTPNDSTLVWSAHKRIQWKRRYPASECLLLLAEEVVFDWLSYSR